MSSVLTPDAASAQQEGWNRRVPALLEAPAAGGAVSDIARGGRGPRESSRAGARIFWGTAAETRARLLPWQVSQKSFHRALLFSTVWPGLLT